MSLRGTRQPSIREESSLPTRRAVSKVKALKTGPVLTSYHQEFTLNEPSSEMSAPTLHTSLRGFQPNTEPNLTMVKRNTTPNLKLSTSGLSQFPSTANSDLSPCLSPGPSTSRAYTFPLDKVREGYVRTMAETLSKIEANTNTQTQICPVPRFYLNNLPDENPLIGSHQKLPTVETSSSDDAATEFDLEFPNYIYSHPVATEIPDTEFWPEPMDLEYQGDAPSSSTRPQRPLHHRRTPTADSGIGSSTLSGVPYQSSLPPSFGGAATFEGSEDNTVLQRDRPGCSNTSTSRAVRDSVLDGPIEGIKTQHFHQPLHESASFVIESSAAQHNEARHTLSAVSVSAMKSYILDPLINDPRFQSFYQLCSNALLLLQAGRIGSLRDLEKHLIFFADSQSSTHNPQLCLEFCKTVLKYLEGSLSQIPEVDLKRENDPLYTRGYFMDMGHQITERINSLVMNKEENSELQYAERWDNRLAILEAEEYTSTLQQPLVQMNTKSPRQRRKQFSSPTINQNSGAPPKVVKKSKVKSPKSNITFNGLSPSIEGIFHQLQNPVTSLSFPQTGLGYGAPLQPASCQQLQQQHGYAIARYQNAPQGHFGNLQINPSLDSFGLPISSDSTYQFRFDPENERATNYSHSRTEEQNQIGVSFLPTKEHIALANLAQPQLSLPKGPGAKQQARRTSVAGAKCKSLMEKEISIPQKCTEPQCGQAFSRPCDLTKHLKTHTRPHKCREVSCLYNSHGFPTEKERDRHIMDKHSLNAKEYPCEYPPCGYKSKRESNCKQHMEKAHDYVYVRTKSNKKKGPKPQPTKVDRAKQSRAKKLSGVVDTAPVYTQQEVTSPMLPAQRIMDEQIPEEHQYANPQGLALPTTPRQYNEEHSFTDLLTASLTDYAGSPSQYFVPNDPMLPMMFTYSQGEDVIPNGTYTENGLNTPIYDFSQEWS